MVSQEQLCSREAILISEFTFCFSLQLGLERMKASPKNDNMMFKEGLPNIKKNMAQPRESVEINQTTF